MQMTHYNGLTETTTVNSRLQPASIQAAGLLTLGYTYQPPTGSTTTNTGNNGNIYEQTVTPGSGAGPIYLHYDYDGLNRIQWSSVFDAAGGNSRAA